MKNLISTAVVMLFCISLLSQTPVNLKLNLEKGKVYKIINTGTQTIQRTMNEQNFTMEIQSNSFTSFKILDRENDVMLIEFKFDTIASKINSPMFKKETNSAIPSKSGDPQELVMNKLSTYKLIAKISTSGKFVGFVNYNTFKDSVMRVMDSETGDKKLKIQKIAEGILKESGLQTMIEPLFAYFPEKPIIAGDKWETSYILSTPMASLVSMNTFHLNSIENSTAKVSGISEIEALPSNEPSAKQTLDLKGTSTANLDIDISTGLIIKNSVKGHLDGTVTVKNQGNEMKAAMVIDSQSEIRFME